MARVAERVRQGGHNVPEDVIRRRFERGLSNFFTLYQAVADSWQVFDNSQLAGPRLIASGRSTSRIEVMDEDFWHHLQEIHA